MASNLDVNTQETITSCEYSVLVVGFIGVGKSAFCNFFTETKRFNAFEGFFGEGSNEINKQHCNVLGKNLTIIDCPGFGDTEKTIEEYSTELVAYLSLHRISIDIIILVINLAKRFSQEESELFLKMLKMLGYFWENIFCVFTHAGYLEKNFKAKQSDSSDETKFDYIELIKNSSKTSQELKELLNNVQDRYLCIETVDMAGEYNYWRANVNKLFETFKKIRENWVERERKEEMMEKSKEEMGLINCSIEVSKPEDHHENEIIAPLADLNAELAERVSRVEKQIKEMKEDQNKTFKEMKEDQNKTFKEIKEDQDKQFKEIKGPNKQLKEIKGQNNKDKSCSGCSREN